MTFRTRFAPSPTGPLHLGHAYSALLAQDMAFEQNGDFLLRIEDIDRSRFRTEWEAQIYDELAWLGLRWPDPVMRQSERMPAYHEALQKLWYDALLYPCTCSRRDIREATSAPQEGSSPDHGPDGLIYPGICREDYIRTGKMPKNVTLRLDMQSALERIELTQADFIETGSDLSTKFNSYDMVRGVGDIVLARRDMGTSYHLSVVLDDAAQGITHVVRGEDLFEATKIHVVLQRLLGLPTPTYHHHKLIRDELGKRLAKRDDARAISLYRNEGASSQDIRAMVGL